MYLATRLLKSIRTQEFVWSGKHNPTRVQGIVTSLAKEGVWSETGKWPSPRHANSISPTYSVLPMSNHLQLPYLGSRFFAE